MPPSNCTSKWRIFMTRLEPSRTTAKASGNKASSVSPLARRSLNSCVLARRASSDSCSSAVSIALMRTTLARYCLSRRSLRLPKILVRIFVAMNAVPTGQPTWATRAAQSFFLICMKWGPCRETQPHWCKMLSLRNPNRRFYLCGKALAGPSAAPVDSVPARVGLPAPGLAA